MGYDEVRAVCVTFQEFRFDLDVEDVMEHIADIARADQLCVAVLAPVGSPQEIGKHLCDFILYAYHTSKLDEEHSAFMFVELSPSFGPTTRDTPTCTRYLWSYAQTPAWDNRKGNCTKHFTVPSCAPLPI